MRRLYSLGILLLVALVVTVAVQPARSAPTAAPRDSAFGTNSHIASRYPDPSSMDVPAAKLEQLGIGWAREDFQMSRILENNSEDWNWEFHDNMVDELTSRGISIVGILGGPTPTWANSQGGFYPPSPEDFAAFCSGVVSRYKGRVNYWEIWNEPADQDGRHWSPAPDPAAYTALLKQAYSAIKAADPNAQVLIGGDVTPQPSMGFLQAVADNGGWNSFDIISIHPYVDGQGVNPSGSPETGKIAANGYNQVKGLAEKLGYKPIWVTEFGWSTGGPGSRAVFNQQDQANFLVRGAVMLRAEGAERVLSYNFKDEDDKQYGFFPMGSGNDDYSNPKTAYTAFQTMNEQLAGTTPGGQITLGSEEVLIDFGSTGTWQRGDQPYGTFDSGTLSYNFPDPSSPSFVIFETGSPQTLPAGVSQIAVKVDGDGSSHALNLWFRDAQGRIQFRLGRVGGNDNTLMIPINQPGENLDNLGTTRMIQFPADLIGVALEQDPTSPQNGTIQLRSISSVAGPESYGARFRKGGETIDVLWAAQPATVPIWTNSAQATVYDSWGDSRQVTSSGGKFDLTLGPDPVYLHHQPGQPQTQPTTPPAQPTPQPTTQPTQPTTPPSQPTTPPSQPVPSGERCFDETGYCISGNIRAYWERNGGLAVFGFPISAQSTETIEDWTGPVQWFERDRLEDHGNDGVMAGRLGAAVLDMRGTPWESYEQVSSAPVGCRFFEATGHSLCEPFLSYWQSNGGVERFGYPITEPIEETIEGWTGTVQWFERRRMEHHPENEPPYDILLGLLGNEVSGN